LGWLLDPETESVEIYRPDGHMERIAGTTRVEGEGPVAGFVLELARVWNPLGK